jgi:hypothetical protein
MIKLIYLYNSDSFKTKIAEAMSSALKPIIPVSSIIPVSIEPIISNIPNFSIDPISVSSVSLSGSKLKFKINKSKKTEKKIKRHEKSTKKIYNNCIFNK